MRLCYLGKWSLCRQPSLPRLHLQRRHIQGAGVSVSSSVAYASTSEPVLDSPSPSSQKANRVTASPTGSENLCLKPRGRRERRRKTSPSEALINALKNRNIRVALPRLRLGKRDLSFFNPQGKKTQRNAHGQHTGRSEPVNHSELRVHNVLAAYISALDVPSTHTEHNTGLNGNDDEVVKKLRHSPEFIHVDRYLADRGYTWKDVKLWCCVVTAQDDVSAAKSLSIGSLNQEHSTSSAQRVPIPIFLFFLRRERLSAEAVRHCVALACKEVTRARTQTHLETRVNSQDNVHSPLTGPSWAFNTSTFSLIIVRLLRHARQSLPEAILPICELLTLMPTLQSDKTASRKERLRDRQSAIKKCTYYNRVLKLLALPPNAHPYHSAALMQRAQFDLLGFMAKHEPTIAINRQGYRAISQVLLANKKTQREQDWARLKGKSWPPWKEEKMGFDSDKGPEYGVSRALEAIQKAREAGYGSWMWEQVATILSGWDTDRSPTVQTRAYLLHQRISGDNQVKRLTFEARLWSARIRATRTVQEAWACFLAYEDETQGKPCTDQSAYLAMFEKLHVEYRAELTRGRGRTAKSKPTENGEFGGGSKEVLPVPESPKEQTYVRLPPPSMDELANQMYAKGVHPTGDCLAFLIANAHAAEEGLKYLDWAALPGSPLKDLLRPQQATTAALNRVPWKLFDAFVQLLCRFDSIPRLLQEHDDVRRQHSGRPRNDPGAFLAYRLLRSRKIASSSSWYKVASRMVSSPLPLDLHRKVSTSPDVETIERWSFVRSVVRQMHEAGGPKMEARFFLLLNQTLAPAILAAHRVVRQARQQRDLAEGDDPRQRRRNAISVAASILGQDTPSSNSKLRNITGRQSFDRGSMRTAEQLLKDSGPYMQGVFNEVFGNTAMSASRYFDDAADTNEVRSHDGLRPLPRMLSAPYPAMLHAYVRCLGLLGDWQSLAWLSKWIKSHVCEIDEAAKVPKNGLEMRRRIFVAFRVFLERAWLLDGRTVDELTDGQRRPKGGSSGTEESVRKGYSKCSSERTFAAPQHIISDVKAVFDSTKSWGGWPSDGEVYEYCHGSAAGDFPAE